MQVDWPRVPVAQALLPARVCRLNISCSGPTTIAKIAQPKIAVLHDANYWLIRNLPRGEIVCGNDLGSGGRLWESTTRS